MTALAKHAAGFIGSGDTASQGENALAIFGCIAVTAALSGLFLIANRLIDWVRGAEGPAKHAAMEEEISVTGAHEVVAER